MGDSDPARRSADRRYFPLLSLAGLCAVVTRRHGWRDQGQERVVAVTGRSALDVRLAELGARAVIVDGYALLESSSFRDAIGVSNVRVVGGGHVKFDGAYEADGLLWRRGPITVVPYLWRDMPEDVLPAVLGDLRRVVGPILRSVTVVEGPLVLAVHYRYPDRDAVFLANLTDEPATVRLHPAADRPHLWLGTGQKVVAESVEIEAHEVLMMEGRA